ncbi:conserved hypothetical protein [Candidatus Desulfosporosinus infrequens]|uniref:Metal-binding protein n=1 Tax=Candidatus Desulfosporosinus infrequens TaxID=2043169 RepID=A0A2U3KXB2_9FIRM|nr:conserved hypothetical protein [Candidatus Desulfosporosinus infrequens]
MISRYNDKNYYLIFEVILNLEIDFNDLIKNAQDLNATHAAIANVKDLVFNEDFRKQCEQNICGFYNTNWMCPPAFGPISNAKERVMRFQQGLLIQSVHKLKSSFDWKGMMTAVADHTKIFRDILDSMEKNYSFKEILPLNAGPCTYCEKCGFLDGEKCRFPAQAVSSVEANGIDVMDLEKKCGMPYYNGENTVSYVGLILFNVA